MSDELIKAVAKLKKLDIKWTNTDYEKNFYGSVDTEDGRLTITILKGDGKLRATNGMGKEDDPRLGFSVDIRYVQPEYIVLVIEAFIEGSEEYLCLEKYLIEIKKAEAEKKDNLRHKFFNS